MAGYKQFSLKDKTCFKVLKPNEIFPKKKTFFLTCDNTSLFGKFPSLCNSIYIFKHVYSLPGCLLHHLVQEIFSENFHKTFLAKCQKSCLASFLAQTKQNFLENLLFSVLSCVQWTSGFILAQAGVTFNTKTYFSGYNSYLQHREETGVNFKMRNFNSPFIFFR